MNTEKKKKRGVSCFSGLGLWVSWQIKSNAIFMSYKQKTQMQKPKRFI